MHFIQCEESTDILGIVNEFVQYVQSYFQYVEIPINVCIPTIADKNISRKSRKETKRSKELLYMDRYFLNGWVYFSLGQVVFQLKYEHFIQNRNFSSSLVFAYWCPFVTILKCCNLQSHYSFFQVYETASYIVPILYNKLCTSTGD